MAIQEVFDRINGRIERLRDDTSDSIEQLDVIVSANIATLATDSHKRFVAQDQRTERIAQRVEALEAPVDYSGLLGIIEGQGSAITMLCEKLGKLERERVEMGERMTKHHRRIERIENWVGKFIKGLKP
jgi:hypothetical protein